MNLIRDGLHIARRISTTGDRSATPQEVRILADLAMAQAQLIATFRQSQLPKGNRRLSAPSIQHTVDLTTGCREESGEPHGRQTEEDHR